jgi:hypothetical protein
MATRQPIIQISQFYQPWHVSWTTLREQIFAKLRRPYRSEANMNEVGHGMKLKH